MPRRPRQRNVSSVGREPSAGATGKGTDGSGPLTGESGPGERQASQLEEGREEVLGPVRAGQAGQNTGALDDLPGYRTGYRGARVEQRLPGGISLLQEPVQPTFGRRGQ